jgi:hypothetical protein
MNRVVGEIARNALAIATTLCLVSCANANQAAVASPTIPTQINAVLDQQVVQLDLTPGAGQPDIPEARAIEIATSQLPAAAQSPHIASRYVSLTVRTSDGVVTRGISSRLAWLITFTGVSYAPSGTAANVCNCAAAYARPNTVAALDARTGAVIALMGVAS